MCILCIEWYRTLWKRLTWKIHTQLCPFQARWQPSVTKGKYSMSKLNGKIALITGGTSGLGFATAERFLSEGADVIITGRRQAELDSAVRRLGRNVLGVQGDVSNLSDLDRLYATIQKEKGYLDIVFANAGGGSFAPLGAITEEHFDQIFNINVKGLLFTVQKALPLLKDGGAIILNASIVRRSGWKHSVCIALPKLPCVLLHAPGPRI